MQAAGSTGRRVGRPRRAAQAVIRVYQLTLSALVGRQCRHWPTCSDYAHEAIGRHGIWAGAWIGAARVCRCGPFGTHGIDLVPAALPAGSAWYTPWRYGRWLGTLTPSALACEAVEEREAPAAHPLSPPAYLHRAQE